MLNKQFAEVFKGHEKQVVFAYLFGSTAECSDGPLSDIDLAVYVTDPDNFSFNDKLQLHADFCRALSRDDIDLLVLNQTKNLMLLDQITRTGKVIWETDCEERELFELKVQHMAIDFQFQRQREMGV